MSNLLSYAVAVYVTVTFVKVFLAPTWTKEALITSLKWPYDLVLSIVNKVKGV